MGGGSILILALSNFLNIDQHISQGANLIFFIPTSIVAIIIYFKNKNVEPKIGLKLLFSTIVGSVSGALLTSYFKSESLRKYFGIFLLIIGIIDLYVTIKQKKEGVN